MSKRHTHKKSRGGCNECKARRTKCPEDGPPCAACIAREITCQYSYAALEAHRQRNNVSTAELASLYQPNTAKVRDESHLLQLHLMNHWTAFTYLTFCHQIKQAVELEERHLWRTLMPREALRHEFLLEALFALSSLHLSTIESSSTFLQVAIDRHNRSLELFSRALPTINENNCQALLACSLAHFVLGIALFDAVPGCQESTITEHILTSLELYNGPKSIQLLFGEKLRTAPIAVSLARKDMRMHPKVEEDVTAAIQRLSLINDWYHQETAPQSHQCYAHILAELEDCACRLADNVPAASIGWLRSLDQNFIADLKSQKVLPILCFMHWAVLLERSETLWWTFRCGRHLFAELSCSLGELQPQEQKALAWCQHQLTKERISC